MKPSIYCGLILIALLFSACSSKDYTLIDTNTQQKNAKEALRGL